MQQIIVYPYLCFHVFNISELTPQSLVFCCLGPLSSTELVEPLPNKLSGYASRQSVDFLLYTAAGVSLKEERWDCRNATDNVHPYFYFHWPVHMLIFNFFLITYLLFIFLLKSFDLAL
jgi:hypothetical protein